MESAEILLETGQRVHLREGMTQVVTTPSPKPFHYKMTAEHNETLTKPRDSDGRERKPIRVACECADYDTLVNFIKQLEGLGYVMLNLERVPGEAPWPA